jgi:GNAT superfamily N-acetyltransferase
MDEWHPKEPHWYLPILAVEPLAQGKGLGSALMRHALEVADDAGVPAYLESSNPRNIPLYLRHGFEVLGEIQIGAGPRVTPMFRHPRGA